MTTFTSLLSPQNWPSIRFLRLTISAKTERMPRIPRIFGAPHVEVLQEGHHVVGSHLLEMRILSDGPDSGPWDPHFAPFRPGIHDPFVSLKTPADDVFFGEE